MAQTQEQLQPVVTHVAKFPRVAVDTEADSLHCYFEKLCLLQISIPGHDFLIDPLANMDLDPLAQVLLTREIVLQGADYDLRLMRRSFGFVASGVFDTVIAARLLGIRQFSLAALVERYFGITLAKGSQKANWAQRPLPAKMAQYAINDTRFLLPLAEKLEVELKEKDRFHWFQQSCARAVEQAGLERERDDAEAWRISGAGALRGLSSAVLRSLWQWRDAEARAGDRPPFHILQNSQLIDAAKRFAAGETPDFAHLTARRRRLFQEAARTALATPESEWPKPPPRRGNRPTAEMEKRAEMLRQRRDKIAHEYGLEPSFIAPRATLDAIAASEEGASELLVPWQRTLLGLDEK